ncbi:Retinol dehydrogenase 12 [Ceratobasidium sp. 392]|nr:Retinol dehydrogenase 12 [Ceratobasidium sp. 392]
MGARVVLACRNPVKAREAKEKIMAATGSSLIEVEILDCAKFDSIRNFIDRWNERESNTVDVLINNTGVIYTKLSVTEDGFEQDYQSNHLSHILLATLLLNRGNMAPDARIISISTGAFLSSDPLNRRNTDSKDIMARYNGQTDANYTFQDAMQVYGRSKAAIVVWAIVLQRRLAQTERWKNVSVHVCNPCAAKSMLWEQPNASATDQGTRFFKYLVDNVIALSNEQGAVVPLWLATAAKPAEPEFRGMYWDRLTWQWMPPWVLEQERQDELWIKWYEDVKCELSS